MEAIIIFTKIETGKIEENKLQCVFLLIYCKEGLPYEKYNKLTGRKYIPIVLSLSRHDGYIGFIGGKVDPGETLKQALKREVMEEAGIEIDTQNAIPLATYDGENANIHSFKYEVTYSQLKKIVKNIENAEHFGIEITGYALNHINNYINEGGYSQLLNQNWKATGKMELEELVTQEGLLF